MAQVRSMNVTMKTRVLCMKSLRFHGIGSNRRISKKAQLQLIETVAVLVIFFILVAIGLTFYSSVVKTGYNREATAQLETTAVEIAKRAGESMEFSCSEDNVPREVCVDEVKLIVAPAYLRANATRFFSLFGFSKISVSQLYPPPQKSYVLWNNPLRNASISTVIHFPINIWYPVEQIYTLGEMRVEVYAS